MGALVAISMVALQALELPNIIFRAYLASSGVTLTIGLFFILTWGVSGAMIGWLVSYIVAATTMIILLSKRQKFGTVY
jgi:O-antigen/teichoic acid export membrane protein